jgi:homogentisate 1,2-dioxygenase
MNEIQTLQPSQAMRDKVQRLEAVMMGMPQAECPIRHFFAPGIYAREITIDADVTVTGAVHKTENLICVSVGRLRVMTEDGSVEVAAGETITCKAGMKNAVYAIEKSRWTNFFANPTDESDVDKLVEILTEAKACELLGGSKNPQLLAQAEREKLEN